MSRGGATRALLVALAVSTAVPGIWATLAPRGFFTGFPGPGAGEWVAALPPFNAHLTTDVGAFYMAFAGLFAWAAARPDPALVMPLVAAWTVFSVLHLRFHATHLDGVSAPGAAAQIATLAAVLAAGAALVRLTARAPA